MSNGRSIGHIALAYHGRTDTLHLTRDRRVADRHNKRKQIVLKQTLSKNPCTHHQGRRAHSSLKLGPRARLNLKGLCDTLLILWVVVARVSKPSESTAATADIVWPWRWMENVLLFNSPYFRLCITGRTVHSPEERRTGGYWLVPLHGSLICCCG
jgi:hypothetical protein